MTLPTITEECVLAQLSKATQQPMDEFAADVMMELTSEQPVKMACIVALLEPFMKPQPEIQDVSLEQAQEVVLQATMTVVGIILKSLNAQSEANEMNEHWG